MPNCEGIHFYCVDAYILRYACQWKISMEKKKVSKKINNNFFILPYIHQPHVRTSELAVWGLDNISIFLSYKVDSHSRCGTEELSSFFKTVFWWDLFHVLLWENVTYSRAVTLLILSSPQTASSDFIAWSRRRRGKIKEQKKKKKDYFFSYFALSFSIDAHTSKCTHRRASTRQNHIPSQLDIQQHACLCVSWALLS